MATQKTEKFVLVTKATQESRFVAPFTQEEFRGDVLTLYVHQLRVLAWMTGVGNTDPTNATPVWKVLGKSMKEPNGIFDPDFATRDFDLTWDDIVHTDFATCLDYMYQYAYFGIYISDTNFDRMEDESIFTWLSAILYDMKRSEFIEDWSAGYGGEGKISAAHCYNVAELANARRILETGYGFSSLLSAATKNEGLTADGVLTVRQMALLAGMEEMSIRAAAGPSRTNRLETTNDEGRTRIPVATAKAWLQSKDRYLTVTVQYKSGNIDLTTRKFSDVNDLLMAINSRRLFLATDEHREQQINSALSELTGTYGFPDINSDAIANADFVRGLANILEFHPEMFSLRVREAIAENELAEIRFWLRQQNEN